MNIQQHFHISFQVLSSHRPAGRKRWQCFRQARQVPNFEGFCLKLAVASKMSAGNLLAVPQKARGFFGMPYTAILNGAAPL